MVAVKNPIGSELSSGQNDRWRVFVTLGMEESSLPPFLYVHLVETWEEGGYLRKIH